MAPGHYGARMTDTGLTRRILAPAAALALCVGLSAGVAAPASAEQARVAKGKCTSEVLSKKKAIRTRSGAKLGTAQVFGATRGKHAGFCIKTSPVRRLRKVTTLLEVKNKTFFPDGSRSSSGVMGGSGLWRHPFILTGSDFGSGYTIKAVVKLKVPGGRSGKAKVTGTLG